MEDKQKIRTEPFPSNITFQIKSRKNIIVVLTIIGIVGFVLRLNYLPFEIPIALDAIGYFAYSFFISQNNQFPIGVDLPNNGWPTFLSIFFLTERSLSILDLTIIQRLVTISLSVITIIPIYLICKKFFDFRIALCGAAIFCFEPRIIINSVLGVSEPLYIFLGSSALACILNKNSKFDYASFSFAALFTLVRYEGLIILIPLSIFLLLKNRKNKKNIFRYLILISIFIIILIPMITIRMDTMGYDGITSHLFASTNYISDTIIQGLPDKDDFIYDGTSEKNNPIFFVSFAIENYIKYFGFVTIPVFIFFISLSIIYILKNKVWKKFNNESVLIISFIIIMSIPALFAYGRGIQETRYLYILYPILCIISLYGLNEIFKKIDRKKIFIMLLLLGIIFSSIIFLEYKKIDYGHLKESFEISKEIVKNTDRINADPIDGSFLTVVSLMNNMKSNSSIYDSGQLASELTKVPLKSLNSLDEVVKSNKLTHIILDESNTPSFLNDVFYHEEKYVFLEKIFDSKEKGYKYHVKIFQINYDRYYEIKGQND